MTTWLQCNIFTYGLIGFFDLLYYYRLGHLNNEFRAFPNKHVWRELKHWQTSSWSPTVHWGLHYQRSLRRRRRRHRVFSDATRLLSTPSTVWPCCQTLCTVPDPPLTLAIRDLNGLGGWNRKTDKKLYFPTAWMRRKPQGRCLPRKQREPNAKSSILIVQQKTSHIRSLTFHIKNTTLEISDLNRTARSRTRGQRAPLDISSRRLFPSWGEIISIKYPRPSQSVRRNVDHLGENALIQIHKRCDTIVIWVSCFETCAEANCLL